MPRWRRPLPALALVPLVCLAFLACAEENGTVGNWLPPDHPDDAGGASGCEAYGKTFEAGESVAMGCSSCTCQAGGAWQCPLIPCGYGGAAGANDGEAGTGGAATGEGGAGG